MGRRTEPGTFGLSLLQQAPVNFNIYVGALAGHPEFMHECKPLQELPQDTLNASRKYVTGVRSRLAMPFREMTDEDLMVSGFTMAVQKRHPV